jgi:hypothetical protein
MTNKKIRRTPVISQDITYDSFPGPMSAVYMKALAPKQLLNQYQYSIQAKSLQIGQKTGGET